MVILFRVLLIANYDSTFSSESGLQIDCTIDSKCKDDQIFILILVKLESTFDDNLDLILLESDLYYIFDTHFDFDDHFGLGFSTNSCLYSSSQFSLFLSFPVRLFH